MPVATVARPWDFRTLASAATQTKFGRQPSLPLSPSRRAQPAKSTKPLEFAERAADAYNTMWCKQCQQDVPGVASGEAGSYRCLRCGVELVEGINSSKGKARDGEEATNPGESHPPLDGLESTPSYDSWELEEHLRHIQRLLAIDREVGQRSEPSDSAKREGVFRLDAAHGAQQGWHRAAALQAKLNQAQTSDAQSETPKMPALTWTVLALGLTACVCGSVLLGWSVVGQRPDLWSIGMPIGLGGQIVLLIGFILQLDRLWHDNRSTAAKLHQVDEQLHGLQSSNTGTSSGTFYSHMAEGVSPHLLLADLKSQLDMLASRLGQADG